MLLAYTDGLVERRDQPLASRLELLSRVGRAAAELPLRRVPEFIGSSLLVEGEPREDDVAMIAIQLASADDLHLRLPAEPTSLAVVRRALDGYLTRAGATSSDIFDLKVACGEACTNVIEHAYGTRPGVIRLSVEAADGGVSISVRDTGEWRERKRPSAGGRGNGFKLMRRLTDQLEVDRTNTTGTEVRMFRRLTR
jgi:anti-sigma regulatory factor (Ser/Thr protein kinase)